MKRAPNCKPVEKLSLFRKRALHLPMTEEEIETLRRYNREDSHRRYGTVSGRARALFNSASLSARKNDLKFDLTKEWIEKKLSQGKCEVSGIDFDLQSLETGKYGAGSQNPFAPSLDRKIPDKGYTKNNVNVVVWIYNVCKQNHSHADVMKLAENLVNFS